MGPLNDIPAIRRFRKEILKPSGVTEPTTLVINLEGRFPSVGVLVELIMPLAKTAKSGVNGPLVLIVCTQDESVRTVVRALAQFHDLPIYLAPSPRQLQEAEPAGPLTPTERETLQILRELGGRATISMFAEAAGLESNAATNRLVNLSNKRYVNRIERPRREGHFFIDPRAAQSVEEPADPTSGDYRVPESVRRDVRSLAEMQVLEEGAHLANAWEEFFVNNQDYLAAEHEKLAQIVMDGDIAKLEEIGGRFSEKQIRAHKIKKQP